jgi:aminopeptidase N
MAKDSTVTVYLKDYSVPPQSVAHVDLTVRLHAAATQVESKLHVKVREAGHALILNGEGLQLQSILIDDTPQPVTAFSYHDDQLIIHDVPSHDFMLTIVQTCDPASNTALSGLYVSNAVYCTQMEAEGFRRFAFMQDRPDVMATYRVRIEAPVALPVLLSNGNLIEHGTMAEGQHFAIWQDPHPKPTYLFALVAGDLASVHDRFVTSEGRNVALGIYVEKGKEDRCSWAMESLKASMRWDEERFGRAYDLDIFNIVAVSDFNMGAMENKGLNIFNDKYILARPETATDADYVNIERIIAHEYFHNWTGNRITCRDWFQLCLKEGLTVFRDQEFTSDLRSRAVKRIEDVKTLRARQFPEDQGPLAHPVRPSSYIEINNFYTPTVYEKGAEICRMLLTLMGQEQFRKATDLYFQRHDGEAATVEDFLSCMADVSGRNLQHFARWYEQAGTPVVTVRTKYDTQQKTFTIQLAQHTPDTPGQTDKTALHIPLQLKLLDAAGQDINLPTKKNIKLQNGLFEFTSQMEVLTFGNLEERPVLSINRGFSAPVILQTDATDSDLLFQMGHDSDSFNRWEAAQTAARRLLIKAYEGVNVDVSPLAQGLKLSLQDATLDNAFKALMLQLPGEAEIAGNIGAEVDADRLHASRQMVMQTIADDCQNLLSQILADTKDSGPYKPDLTDTARRSLHLSALSLLSHVNAKAAFVMARQGFEEASNMTMEAGVIGAVLKTDEAGVDDLLQQFYQRHANDHLLVDKWFMLKAARPNIQAASNIETLTKHSAFSFKTPNRVYALIGGFTGGSVAGFHAADGSGYRLLADIILKLNGINPQVAARMATSFRSWKLYDAARRDHAQQNMQRILATSGLSADVYEIISRTAA